MQVHGSRGAEVVSLIQQGDGVVEELVTDGMLDIKHDSLRSV
jgi:hypothetical protein